MLIIQALQSVKQGTHGPPGATRTGSKDIKKMVKYIAEILNIISTSAEVKEFA